MKKQMKQYQQGDVLFTKVQKVNGQVRQRGGRIVLAEGEATNHFHVVEDDDATLIAEGERMLLSLGKAATITHEEHKPIELPAGTYEVGRVKEWDYLEQMERTVVD